MLFSMFKNTEILNNSFVFYVLALLGSVSFKAAKSCQHIIQRGESTGDGEYWVDPQGNGSPFKVFCDMTTDGGTAMFCIFVDFASQ